MLLVVRNGAKVAAPCCWSVFKTSPQYAKCVAPVSANQRRVHFDESPGRRCEVIPLESLVRFDVAILEPSLLLCSLN